jgi:hypothetical protein
MPSICHWRSHFAFWLGYIPITSTGCPRKVVDSSDGGGSETVSTQWPKCAQNSKIGNCYRSTCSCGTRMWRHNDVAPLDVMKRGRGKLNSMPPPPIDYTLLLSYLCGVAFQLNNITLECQPAQPPSTSFDKAPGVFSPRCARTKHNWLDGTIYGLSHPKTAIQVKILASASRAPPIAMLPEVRLWMP